MALNPSISKVLPASPAVASANYDYFDIAEGTGIQNFYGAQAEASGGILVAFLTTDKTICSNKVTEKVAMTPNSPMQNRSELDYDVTFNKSRIIRGNPRLSITQGLSVSGGVQVFVRLWTFLYHVDGKTSTETLMASGATIQTAVDALSPSSDTRLIPYDLKGKIWHFRKGDILRLTVQLWSKVGNNADCEAGYACDPADRNDTEQGSLSIIIEDEDTTQLKLSIPFVLDI